MKLADPLDAFDRAISEVIGMLVPTTILSSRSGDKQWFDPSCRRAYDATVGIFTAYAYSYKRI